MRGKLGIIVGLAAGYVLGSRAGRERYEQIKEGASRLWEMDPVQRQVDKAKDFGRTAAMALPSALWDGAVKVAKAAGTKGTPQDKLDATVTAAKKAGADVAAEAKKAADAAAAQAESAASSSRADAATETAEDVPSIEEQADEKAADR